MPTDIKSFIHEISNTSDGELAELNRLVKEQNLDIDAVNTYFNQYSFLIAEVVDGEIVFKLNDTGDEKCQYIYNQNSTKDMAESAENLGGFLVHKVADPISYSWNNELKCQSPGNPMIPLEVQQIYSQSGDWDPYYGNTVSPFQCIAFVHEVFNMSDNPLPRRFSSNNNGDSPLKDAYANDFENYNNGSISVEPEVGDVLTFANQWYGHIGIITAIEGDIVTMTSANTTTVENTYKIIRDEAGLITLQPLENTWYGTLYLSKRTSQCEVVGSVSDVLKMEASGEITADERKSILGPNQNVSGDLIIYCD